jgi:hypothetical protein
MIELLKKVEGLKTLGICALALGFVALDAGFKLGILSPDVQTTIVLGALTFGGMRFISTGPAVFRKILVLATIPLFMMGCASQTKSIEKMHTTSTENGYPMVTVIHAEQTEQGLHLQVGPDQATLIQLFLGSEDIFGNFTTAPLGDDSFLWEHINRLDADAAQVDGAVSGRTLIRIDAPQYLGPLRE